METRANHILIGAFSIAGFLGILGFFLWFARVELDRRFAYYDIDFRSVSGLGDASGVRFAGLPVGQVVDVRLSPESVGRVRVRIEVDAETPVRTDSVATIEMQGVTGVSFVAIGPGTPEAPLLAAVSDEEVPRIEAGQSVLQTLSREAPQILSETLATVGELRRLMGGENRRRIETILGNLERSSAAFAGALGDFSVVTGTVADVAYEIDRFNTTLETLSGDVSDVLAASRITLGAIDDLSDDTRRLLARGSETLLEARTLIETYIETGDVATARLTEARETLAAVEGLIARLDGTLGNVDAVARRLDGLLSQDARPLMEELRVAATEATAVIRLIGETAGADLPAILGAVRAAADRTAQVVETLGADLSSASARVDELTASATATLDGVRVTFARANETLTAINGALETGDRALVAAEKALTSADRVMNEDVAAIAARLRGTLSELETAVGGVAEQIPDVAADLRAASRSARTAFAEIESAVGAGTPAVRDFATTALPQYARLAAETRALIGNLDTLVEQIRRDPSRFFLDPRAPEFRR